MSALSSASHPRLICVCSTGAVATYERPIEARAERRVAATGGAAGNERLTGLVAAILLVLLAAEGATILRIHNLVTPHVFIGMLLVPPVALKVGSTGYRFLRYYAGSLEYRLKGPPALVLRVLVAPAVLLSTAALFATGIALVVVGPGGGIVVGLHKASFIVWFFAMAAHVLWHVRGLPPLLGSEVSGRARVSGRSLRLVLVLAALVAGVGLAAATLPEAHAWAHWAASFRGDG
jgi:hypothetical protein